MSPPLVQGPRAERSITSAPAHLTYSLAWLPWQAGRAGRPPTPRASHRARALLASVPCAACRFAASPCRLPPFRLCPFALASPGPSSARFFRVASALFIQFCNAFVEIVPIVHHASQRAKWAAGSRGSTRVSRVSSPHDRTRARAFANVSRQAMHRSANAASRRIGTMFQVFVWQQYATNPPPHGGEQCSDELRCSAAVDV